MNRETLVGSLQNMKTCCSKREKRNQIVYFGTIKIPGTIIQFLARHLFIGEITSSVYFLKNRLRNRNNPKTHTSERTRAISVQQA